MADLKDIEKTAKTEIPKIEVQEAIEGEDVTLSPRVKGKGVLERYINFPAAINFGFVLQASWETVALTFQFSLLNGGPAAMLYGSLFAGIGTNIVAASLAEMASIDPSVGAQYRWTAKFAPQWNKFWGLMQGWITVFAWMFGCILNPAALAQIVVGLSVFNSESYVPQRWHTTLLIWGFTVVPFLGSLYFRKMVDVLETFGSICHIVFFVVCIAVLAVLGERSTPGFVFNTLTHDVSGWTDPGVAWGIGLLTVTLPLVGFDSVIHMSDEVKEVRRRLPRSMILACAVNSVMQFIFILCLLFTIGDINKVANTPTALPIIEVLYQATRSKPATNFIVAMLGVVYFIAFFNVLASASRLVWAFSRDNGLPFSKLFADVHPGLKTPLNALVLVGTTFSLLALINIGSSTAFNTFFSLPALLMYISYFFPILFFLLKRFSNDPPKFGPFSLGKWGVFFNLCALCYILFIITWMPFPTMRPVTAINMNYAGPLVAAVVLGALLDWIFSGRKRFQIPVLRHTPEL
ncbi:hypothetical protein H2201_002354 [Coniosporium apollinis]|uniref:Amino acid transporter n=1 Tax=Coniosporium apollinis TaxID=61459 RepID=A0ABQ9NYM8_9PEZI|nr:hypothetical protein H2201_002354 [Coniosporium apollinis]